MLIFALMPLLAFLSFSSYQMVISYNRTLLPPTKQPQPISAHPDVPLPTNQQPIERTATVPRQDLSAFRAHLANTGPDRSWLVQDHGRKTLLITMPEQDIRELDPIVPTPL